jgi:hypothetical protein
MTCAGRATRFFDGRKWLPFRLIIVMAQLDGAISLSGGTVEPVPAAWDGPVEPGHDGWANLELIGVLTKPSPAPLSKVSGQSRPIQVRRNKITNYKVIFLDAECKKN